MLGPMEIVLIVVGVLLALGVGLFCGYLYRKRVAERKVAQAEDAVHRMIEEAQKRAEAIKKENLFEAKEEILRLRDELDKETRDRRNELQRLERRLFQKEETMDRKLESIEQKEQNLTNRQ